MWNNVHKGLAQKEMTRGEFLQFLGASIVLLVGFGNVIALFGHMKKTAEPSVVADADTSHGFGARKFGV